MNDFQELLNKEYLISNGIGGYASSTLSGAHTRRYHGLLVASFNPPTDRKVLVSKVEETAMGMGFNIQFSSNKYQDSVQPQGYNFVKDAIVQDNSVVLSYGTSELTLRKKIEMVQGENTTRITYTNLSDKEFTLKITPLFAYKDYHGMFRRDSFFDFYIERESEQLLKVYPHYGSQPYWIGFEKGRWQDDNFWVEGLAYEQERLRGFDYQEDLKCSGHLLMLLHPGESGSISFYTQKVLEMPALKNPPVLTSKYPRFVKDLVQSANQFVVQRKSTQGSTILAGYHWFTDWGRDTMIAIRGVCIATGRQEEARSILRTFLQQVDRGMLPNRFPDQGEALEYNTIDATLWMFIALYEYYQQFGDKEFIQETLPILEDILHWHKVGTRYNIHLTQEGLLYGGETGYQLTWMDARVGDYVVTPRIGCPVEINALWYNVLKIYNFFRAVLGLSPDGEIQTLAEQCGDSFNRYFINEDKYLNDVVTPGSESDASIRPNQVYALSLPFSPLPEFLKKDVLACIDEHLYTPYGLRTLNPAHPHFRPVYEGDSWNRDTAYHQGTVWPFLWGEYALGYLRLHDFSANACLEIWYKSAVLQAHFYNEGCIQGIAEIFDGLEPQTGKGCVQQAWSVGMMLRVFLDKRFDWTLIEA